MRGSNWERSVYVNRIGVSVLLIPKREPFELGCARTAGAGCLRHINTQDLGEGVNDVSLVARRETRRDGDQDAPLEKRVCDRAIL